MWNCPVKGLYPPHQAVSVKIYNCDVRITGLPVSA